MAKSISFVSTLVAAEPFAGRARTVPSGTMQCVTAHGHIVFLLPVEQNRKLLASYLEFFDITPTVDFVELVRQVARLKIPLNFRYSMRKSLEETFHSEVTLEGMVSE